MVPAREEERLVVGGDDASAEIFKGSDRKLFSALGVLFGSADVLGSPVWEMLLIRSPSKS